MSKKKKKEGRKKKKERKKRATKRNEIAGHCPGGIGGRNGRSRDHARAKRLASRSLGIAWQTFYY